MLPQIYIARKIPVEVENYIAEHFRYKKWDRLEPIPREYLFEQLADCEGLLTSGTRIDQELLDHSPKLKVVSNISVGYNNFDLEAMRERKILGTNTPKVLDDTVADLILSLMLSVARRVPELDRYVRAGHWSSKDDENIFGVDVHHKTLGIIGMGNIGQAVAQRGKWGFGMNILYHNRHPKPDVEQALDAAYRSKEELLRESDFIVLMTPLTPETRHYIGEREFAMMKSSAVFINASRGATVDEAALINALRQKQIFGAGLDVFEQEPVDPKNPLLTMDNVVVLPHIGSATTHTRLEMGMLAARNLVDALYGRKPSQLVKELQELYES